MNSNDEIATLYKKLIKHITRNGVNIREDALVPFFSPYQYLNNSQPQIRVHRQVQPQDEWVDESSTDNRIDLLIKRSNFSLNELIGVAHEFGHSRSADKSIDPLYDKARKDGCLTSDEKSRILNEENFAWSEARKVLIDIGFTQWQAFTGQEIAALATYLAIPICNFD
jgi:hypothetical protein